MKKTFTGKEVQVAVGVIINANQEYLVALRSKNTSLKGYWEFPGGKLEGNETPREALSRELAEEVGIAVVSAKPLLETEYHYETYSVQLYVFLVDKFSGVAHGKEGQPIQWAALDRLKQLKFPEANDSIIEKLELVVLEK